VGDEKEIEMYDISSEFGDIIVLPPNPNFPTSSQCTIANFYATKFYKEDVCFICGIDQIPLSNMFIKNLIEDCKNEEYVMLIADALIPNHWRNLNGTSPTSYHIGLGSTFDEIFKFEDDFKLEVDKIFNLDTLETFLNKNRNEIIDIGFWGIDESYFSMKLRNYNGDIKITSKDNFKLLVDRRVECRRIEEPPYDIEKLKSGWYSEAHLCRPFHNHSLYITNLLNNIETYE
jgi:hypothetical protein